MTVSGRCRLLGALSWLSLTGATCQVPFDIEPGTTGSALRLVQVTSDVNDEFAPSVSDDGKNLVFHERDDSKSFNNRFNIISMKLGSPARTILVEGFASTPSWFPGSREITFISTLTGQRRLARTGTTGGGTTLVSNSQIGRDVTNPVVSPDGTRIAMGAYLGGKWRVATIESGGSNLTIHTDGVFPKWSPDGRQLVYHRFVNGYWQVWAMQFESGQVTQLTSNEADSNQPVWSPDGSWIAFVSRHSMGEAALYKHLFVMKADGSLQTQLTRGNSNNTQPFWAADGRIYFSAEVGEGRDIWSVEPSLPE